MTAQHCACPDDRCAGYHHALAEPCLCGPGLIARTVRAQPRLAHPDELCVVEALRRIREEDDDA